MMAALTQAGRRLAWASAAVRGPAAGSLRWQASAAGGNLKPLPLLRNILRVHRRLPGPMRAVGDEYVLDEFRRHRSASPEFVQQFLQQWTDYLALLREQTAQLKPGPGRLHVGRRLRPEELDSLSEEQIGQLAELRSEATKPWH